MEYPVLAGSSTLAIAAPVDLWAGSAPITTDRGQMADIAIAQYGVIMQRPDGRLIPYDAAATTAKVIGVAAIGSEVANDNIPYYTGGYFNWEKLSADGVTTLIGFQQLFALTTIKVGSILK